MAWSSPPIKRVWPVSGSLMASSSCWSPPITPLLYGIQRVSSPLLVNERTLLNRSEEFVRNGLLGSRSMLRYDTLGELIRPYGLPGPRVPNCPPIGGLLNGLVEIPPVVAN